MSANFFSNQFLRTSFRKMSRGQSQRRTDSRNRHREQCNSKEKTNNVIDVGGDKGHDFIIIDPPESSERTFIDSKISGKGKRPVQMNFIYIDDDDCDNDDRRGDYGSPQSSSEEIGNGDPHFNSINKRCPVPDKSNTYPSAFCDGRKPSSKSSMCWPAYSRKISRHNQQKFNPSSSYEHDDSDPDVVEDHQGNIRQQWQKASLRKKPFDYVQKGGVGSLGRGNSLRFRFNFPSDADGNKTTEGLVNNADENKRAKVPIPSSSSNENYEKYNLRQSARTGEDLAGGVSNKSHRESQFTDLEKTTKHEICHGTFVCETQVVDDMDFQSMSNVQSQNTAKPALSASNGAGPSDAQNSIIGSREVLKSTDAYKRAEEEEWASRHRELQIQAEEARRLRKKRKAETHRLLEMERRQKQRVEEIREAQKKDEETLNLKEQLRIEVRSELAKVEASCTDMASLLCGLGISVGDGLLPSSPEVRAAYKRALLKFHPDRASGSGIREQIEAEEKFKVICRAKEKFMF